MESKRDILKFLSQIGVDTRFISYTPNRIFIDNLRFSKFSRRREEIFNNHFNDIEIIRSGLFQKICVKSSKILSKSLNPRDKVYIADSNNGYDILIDLILEPYTRKYGISIIDSENDYYDKIAISLNLEEEVSNVFNDILSGDKIKTFNTRSSDNLKTIYPLIYISSSLIEDFLNQFFSELSIEKKEYLSNSLMDFLDPLIPDYKENVLKSANYVNKN